MCLCAARHKIAFHAEAVQKGMVMIMKKQLTGILSAGICALAALALFTGCGDSGHSRNLMDDVSAEQPGNAGEDGRQTGAAGDQDRQTGTADENDGQNGSAAGFGSVVPASANADLPAADAVTYTDFAVKLFQECVTGEAEGNVLISPLSVINALAMTAGGARGETLTQMEGLFGADLNSLCSYLKTYNEGLPSDEKYKLHTANSVWVKDNGSFTVSPDFLQINAAYFNADVYMAPFDGSTLKDINGWVCENTDKMIPEILDQIPEDAVMYLINALAFDAEWQKIYNEYQIRDGSFTCEDGDILDVEMMYSSEYTYLQDTQAQGFLKYYSDKKYAFAALLPEEGISIDAYAASLTGRDLHELLSNSMEAPVEAAIPKFETEYSTLLNNILTALGMTDAFDSELADLSGLGSNPAGNLFISRVIHKTYISVDEKGTKAGAATAVEVKQESAAINPVEPKTVYLDRPFVYMIIDCEENLPVFIGAVKDPSLH